MLAAVVEWLFLRPYLLDNRNPFLAVSVPLVMFEKLRAELEFFDVPARHDIETETSVSNVVGGDTGLGSEHRIDERHMDGCEGDNLFGRRKNSGRPRQRLEARTLTIRRSAVAKPSCDRQQKFNPGRIGEPRRLRFSGHPAFQRSGAVVPTEPEQFMPNKPSLNRLPFCILV